METLVTTHHVVEIYLPLTSNDGHPYGREAFDRIRAELLDRFGGVTFFSRSPAEGLWSEGSGQGADRDEIVVVEVLVEHLDREWWNAYRKDLERRLQQDEVLMRSFSVTKL